MTEHVAFDPYEWDDFSPAPPVRHSLYRVLVTADPGEAELGFYDELIVVAFTSQDAEDFAATSGLYGSTEEPGLVGGSELIFR